MKNRRKQPADCTRNNKNCEKNNCSSRIFFKTNVRFSLQKTQFASSGKAKTTVFLIFQTNSYR